MLGAKSTLKDRWRQVLSEAERIDNKHLLTLEPGISENQTSEMQVKQLQLVLPRKLHESFRPAQQGVADGRVRISGTGGRTTAILRGQQNVQLDHAVGAMEHRQ